MTGSMKHSLIVLALLITVSVATAQTQRAKEAFSVQGCPGKVSIVQIQGRELVDVQDLARVTNGSLSFDGDRIILTMRCDDSKPAADDAGKSGFSRAFMRAAIEAMASIREWGGTLYITVQNGYPVGNAMAGYSVAGYTIQAYQDRAADSVALAATAASTDADSRGLELLRNEFNNVQGWSDRFIKARSSLSAADLTMRENALKDDQEVQKMIHCGQFLAQMFAGGTFQEDAACR